MSFETGLQAFKQNKFEPAIEALLVYCKDCDDTGKVTSQKYMQAHMGIVKSYQALKQWEQAIAHCQSLTTSENHPLTIWVDRTLPKLQKAAAKGDTPTETDSEEAKPKQDENMILLQQGMAAYKKMQCDRAIKLLEEYVTVSTNIQSRNYMQAQMTLVKAYKETKDISKAIARCNQLASSENFALKSWASKALPKLKKELGTDTPPSPVAASIAQDQDVVTTDTEAGASAALSTPAPASKTSSSTPSFSFDASPNPKTTSPNETASTHTMDSMSAGLATPPKRTAAKPAARQPSATPKWKTARPPAESPKLVNNSIAHSGIGMVGGAFGSVLGGFVLKRLTRAGIGIAFALIAFVFRGFFGIGSDTTPLQKAVSESNVETVKTLVSKGKSLEAADDDGNTVIYWALFEDTCGVDTCTMSPSQQEIVDVLLTNGASVTVTNAWQETPLHFASSVNGAQEIIRAMIDRGADVNARDAVQMTPLHWAATYGLDDNLELLLNRGADMNAKDADGYTPLDFAITEQSIQLLKARGAVSGQGG